MQSRDKLLFVFAACFGLCFASQSEAAKARKHKNSGAVYYSTAPRYPPSGGFQGGVMVGPLYNGQDYLGDDPDPNIRAYLMKDKSRYGGAR